MNGVCMTKHWSSTPKALGESKGFQSWGEHFGEDLRIRAFVGVQAMLGLIHRARLGKARRKETAGP